MDHTSGEPEKWSLEDAGVDERDLDRLLARKTNIYDAVQDAREYLDGFDAHDRTRIIVALQVRLLRKAGSPMAESTRSMVAHIAEFNTMTPQWLQEATHLRKDMSFAALRNVIRQRAFIVPPESVFRFVGFNIDDDTWPSAQQIRTFIEQDALHGTLQPVRYSIFETQVHGDYTWIDSPQSMRRIGSIEVRAPDGIRVNLDGIDVIAYTDRLSGHEIKELDSVDGLLGSVTWN